MDRRTGARLARRSAGERSLDERLDVAVEHPLDVSDLYAYATIGSAERSTLQTLTIDYDGNASRAGAALTLQVYDFATGAWTVVDGPRYFG